MSTVSDSPAHTVGAEQNAALLHRGLGVGSIVFMVVAAVAPLGATCAVIPLVFALSGNSVAPSYFLAAGLILWLFAVGFTLMSRYVQNAGAFYSYVQAGLGKVAGAGTATLALVTYMVLLVGLYAVLSVQAASVIHTYLDVTVKWWVVMAALALIIGFLGYRDIEVSAKVLGVALVLEALIVLVMDFAIIGHGGASGLSAAPLNPTRMLDGKPGLGLIFAFFCFVGFEATAVFRSEAKEPNKTIPKATYLAVGIIGVLYAFTSWAMSMGTGAGNAAAVAAASPSNMAQNLMGRYVSSSMQDVMQTLLVTSLFACALSFHNVVTRYQFNLANGGVLPAPLATVHPKHRAPSRSSITVSVISGAILIALTVAGLDPITQIYTWFSAGATLGVIVLMVVTSVAVVVFHQRGKDDDPLWNSTIAPVLALAGLGVVLYLVVDNFALLVGGRTAADIICAALVGCWLLGAAFASLTRLRRPQAYAAMLNN